MIREMLNHDIHFTFAPFQIEKGANNVQRPTQKKKHTHTSKTNNKRMVRLMVKIKILTFGILRAMTKSARYRGENHKKPPKKKSGCSSNRQKSTNI
jgi:hypothetical protein